MTDKNQDDDMKVSNLPSSFQLKKNVGVIHMSGKLTSVQQNISDLLLHNAYPQLAFQEEHSMPLKKLKDQISYNSNNNDFLKASIRALMQHVLEMNILEKGKGEEWVASSILAEVRISGDTIYYSYGPSLRAKLANPEVYALIDLKIKLNLDHEYAEKLWENCFRFVNVGTTGDIELSIWRTLLLKDPEKQYPEFKDFKRYIINPAIKVVNDKSNIQIEPTFLRKAESRKITHINFSIKQAEKTIGEENTPQEETLKTLMDEFKIVKDKAVSLCTAFKDEYIKEKIEVVRILNSHKKIRTISGFMIKAIEQNYSIDEDGKKTKPKKESTKKPTEKSFKAQFSEFKANKAREYIDALNEEGRAALINEFTSVTDQTIKSMIKKQGIDSSVVQRSLFKFIVDEKLDQESLMVEFSKSKLT